MKIKKSFEVIGGFFRDKRVDSDVTQAELAKLLKFKSPQMISNWERGLCSPPLESIASMIHIFGLSKDEVMELILDENRRVLNEKFSSSSAKGRRKKKA